MRNRMHLPLMLALTAVAAFPLAGAAGAVDYSKFPSFHHYGVDKENGDQSQARPVSIQRTNTGEPVDAGLGVAEAEKSVFILEQELREFLLLAGKRNNVRISVSSSVRGTIRNLALPSGMDAMLDMLSREFDFEWFRESGVIQVSSVKDSVSRVIFLGRMRMEDLEASIKEAGLSGDGYELSFVENSNSVVVKGPVGLIAKIELITEAFNKRNSGVRIIKRGKEG
jgi:type II secretory pathway component GspD/PulD (secretin)